MPMGERVCTGAGMRLGHTGMRWGLRSALLLPSGLVNMLRPFRLVTGQRAMVLQRTFASTLAQCIHKFALKTPDALALW